MSIPVDQEIADAWMARTFPHGFRCPTCTSDTVTPAQTLTAGRLRFTCARCGYVLSVDMNATDLPSLQVERQD